MFWSPSGRLFSKFKMSEVECSSASENVVGSDEDDEIQLSSHALAALNEFLAEKNAREEQLRRLAEAEDKDQVLNDIDLEENWVPRELALSLKFVLMSFVF